MLKLTLIVLAPAIILSFYAEAEIAPEDYAHATKFLKRYGYMHPENNGDSESMKVAVSAMQQFAGIDATGELNEKTLTKMKSKRCGLPDMDASSGRAKRYKTMSKWKILNLSWGVVNFPTNRSACLTNAKIIEYFNYVFGNWSEAQKNLTFKQAPEGTNGSIIITFGSFLHGDKFGFDGPGDTLAHGFYPSSGRLHYDDSEFWGCFKEILSSSQEYIYFLEVSLHEIGHVLGLGHSDVPGAIMGPYYSGEKETLKPTQDDIDGLKYLYG